MLKIFSKSFGPQKNSELRNESISWNFFHIFNIKFFLDKNSVMIIVTFSRVYLRYGKIWQFLILSMQFFWIGQNLVLYTVFALFT